MCAVGCRQAEGARTALVLCPTTGRHLRHLTMDFDPQQSPIGSSDSLCRANSPWVYSSIVVGGILGVIGAAVFVFAAGRIPRGGVLVLGFVAGGGLGCLCGALVLGIVDFVRQSVRGNTNIASCPSCRGKIHIPEEIRGLPV